MDRMILGFLVARGHPVILLSCLISVVLFLSWIPVSGLPNARADRRGRPVMLELSTDATRPRSVQ